jgi:enoyl-CoA hydratase/carnithine racemase
MAANGGTQRLLAQVPYAVGMELLLTGRKIDARSAERWGLVNRVVPMASLMETAMEYAQEIADNAPLAVQATKEMALRSRDMDLATGLRMEQAMNRILQSTEDVQEGVAAFAEKRPARFRGR